MAFNNGGKSLHQHKSELKIMIAGLNENFNQETLDSLLQNFKSLLHLFHFNEIENWLKSLIEKENLFIAHAILSEFYYEYDFYEQAIMHAKLAQKHFPHLEILEYRIGEYLWVQFENESNKKAPN